MNNKRLNLLFLHMMCLLKWVNLISGSKLLILDKDGKQLDKGKYIVLWKKEEGKWKLFRDCYNSDLPLSH